MTIVLAKVFDCKYLRTGDRASQKPVLAHFSTVEGFLLIASACPDGAIKLDSNCCGIYTWDVSGASSESVFRRQNTPSFPGSRAVTKKEIVKTISEEMGLTQLKTKEIVQKTFNAIIETLVEDTESKLQAGDDGTLGRIELRNFGVFEVKKRAARKARNPRTGERVDVPEKFVVTFKPGKEMEEKVRQLEEREAARKSGLQQAAPAQQQPSSQSTPEPSSPPASPPSYGSPQSLETNPGAN
jgi:integration host factor subunit beta